MFNASGFSATLFMGGRAYNGDENSRLLVCCEFTSDAFCRWTVLAPS